MSYRVFNSTLSIVQAEIDYFSEQHTIDHSYQQVLSLPYFRYKLVTKILNNIPNHHVLIHNKNNFVDDNTFCIGSVDEISLIREKINEYILEVVTEYQVLSIVDKKFIPKHNLIPFAEVKWWIRVDTIKPAMTYYFGPFDSLVEAEENCNGYIEDLIEEKAEGITFDYQYFEPDSLTVNRDIKELQVENEQLWEDLQYVKFEKNYYESLFLFSPDNCLIIDNNGLVRLANSNAQKMLNTSQDKLIGNALNLFTDNGDFQKSLHLMYEASGGENSEQIPPFFTIKLSLPDAQVISVSVNADSIRDCDDIIIGWHLSLHDITQLQKNHDELFYQSRYDSLTNLPNRRSLLEFLENILAKGEEENRNQFAVLFLDINKFKDINDLFGHSTGDEVLIILAKRLITCVRSFDHVARLGGDEFMIVLTHISSPQEAQECAYRIQQSLSSCFHTNQQEIMVNVSIGIVIGDMNSSSLPNVLSHADMAMYRAKQEKQLFSIYGC
ncbi:MAG: diguanylate cyclase domain-containing protein [Cyanobacterium sp.]